MSTQMAKWTMAAVGMLLLATLSPVWAADDGEDKWVFTSPTYLWASGLDGDVTLNGNTADIDLGFDEVFEHLPAVRAALEQLSRTDREALLLKTEGFSYEEIASALGLAKGAIGTTLARARRRLVEAYGALERTDHVAR